MGSSEIVQDIPLLHILYHKVNLRKDTGMENYVGLSIELHLFFLRIMKEHSLFLEAGFPCKDKEWIQRAERFRKEFENLHRDVVKISDRRVSRNVLESGELVTQFTIPAERKTELLSGIPIDSSISRMERALRPGNSHEVDRAFWRTVQGINERALRLLNGLIEFKESILREVGACNLFTANYPLLIQHILREARLYRSQVLELLRNRRLFVKSFREQELFWNQIMMEHALFIRGLLDPTEEQLIDTADGFAEDYKKLLEEARRQEGRSMEEMRKRSLEETLKYREFKTAGAEGILDCKISSIILPLLADHVLREANHYIRLLEMSGER